MSCQYYARIVFDGITYQLRIRPHNFVPFAVRTAHLLGFGFWSTTTDLSFILNYCLDIFLTIQDINTFIRFKHELHVYLGQVCLLKGRSAHRYNGSWR